MKGKDYLRSLDLRKTGPLPEACAKFKKRMRFDASFLTHLPKCLACKTLIAYLLQDAENRAWTHTHRN